MRSLLGTALNGMLAAERPAHMLSVVSSSIRNVSASATILTVRAVWFSETCLPRYCLSY